MSYMQGWYAITDSNSIRHKKPLGLKRFDTNIVLWRNSQNKVIAMQDRCPHRSAKLSLGKIVNDTIQCPFHGFQFADSGECDYAPEFKKSIPGLCTKTYSVIEACDMVWIWWGDKPAEKFTIDRLKELHEKFKGNYAQFNRIWNMPITRCIENQLDYTHLPFVHHNTIGRNFVIPENPQVIQDNQGLQVYRDLEKNKLLLQFFFPNAWNLNIGDKMQLVLYFIPIDETHTIMFLRSYYPRKAYLLGLEKLFNPIMNVVNRIVLQQDEAVVSSQGPQPSYLATEELLMKHDKAIREFRKTWQENLIATQISQ